MLFRSPKCQFEQESSEECLRCGIIFRKYKPLPQPSTTAPSSASDPSEDFPLPVFRLQVEQAEETTTPEPEEPWEDELLDRPSPRRRFGWLRFGFRLFPWVSLAPMIGVFYLTLQEAPPLQIQMDPQALVRVDHKMLELRVAAQRGGHKIGRAHV